jgi:hypothetical protein
MFSSAGLRLADVNRIFWVKFKLLNQSFAMNALYATCANSVMRRLQKTRKAHLMVL